MSDNLGVAIVKYVCPICGQINEEASSIMINSLLTKSMAKKVESMHNQVVGFSDKPCKQCQSIIDQDAFFIIGINSDKTEDMSNPYRSGHLVAIKKSSEFYKHLSIEYKHKDALFMDYREMYKCGMMQK